MSYIQHFKDRIAKLSVFSSYMAANRKKKPIQITIKYRHRKFRNEGYATFDLSGEEIEEMVRAIDKIVEQKITKHNESIREYERTVERGKSLGGMDK